MKKQIGERAVKDEVSSAEKNVERLGKERGKYRDELEERCHNHTEIQSVP